MGKLVTLVVLAVLLFQGYKHGLPFLEKRFGLEIGGKSAAQPGDSAEAAEKRESIRCVDRARTANRAIQDSMRQFSTPPINRQEWTSSFLSLSGDIGSAESACGCISDACNAGYAAALEMRDLALSFDGIARGGSRGLASPARMQEKIENLIDEAAFLAGG